MVNLLKTYLRKSRRLRIEAEQTHQRLDIQGLRMVAVLTVFAVHLWGWPQGGFVGVDVFFVISGFLITGNLLRSAESQGNISFRKFYWNRLRRIVPAATVVLVLTLLASLVAFLPFRVYKIGIDALAAFFFVSNWEFAIRGTDYFAAAADAVSPIQHYWSLSIEEQFYFVWPALIFAIGVVVARKAWNHTHRLRLAGGVMGFVIVASFGWALFETARFPTWAYFNTFARIWELGFGAFLATIAGPLGRIPVKFKPWLSWAGLLVIAASVFLINANSAGFPAPWALMPVIGAALVIGAGVRREPKHQAFLRNPVSVYIGNISYSLYLIHWPVIVILGALLTITGIWYSISAIALSFGLAIASYHFVENPLRYTTRVRARETFTKLTTRSYRPTRSSVNAALASLLLFSVGVITILIRPHQGSQELPAAAAAATPFASPDHPLGPLTSVLQSEIVDALRATRWPILDPPMTSVINGARLTPEVENCRKTDVFQSKECTWGSQSAPTKVILAGDSLALNYAGPLREIALSSNGQIQLQLHAMAGCQFVNDAMIARSIEACPAKKQATIDAIRATEPTIVIIANHYEVHNFASNGRQVTSSEWHESLREITDEIRGSTKKLVFLAAPPADKRISVCFGRRSSTPADCISRVTDQWDAQARVEQDLARSVGGSWIDSRPWFCSGEGLCPSFVESTPTKVDATHMTTAYATKITPAIGESFRGEGVF